MEPELVRESKNRSERQERVTIAENGRFLALFAVWMCETVFQRYLFSKDFSFSVPF